jgi:hypothetical protein
MLLHREQAHAINAAVWLFGLGALFYTGRWWPGILLVIAASVIAEGLAQGKSWCMLQSATWLVGLFAWATFDFALWVLFVILGTSVLLGAFVPPPGLAKKSRPPHETELE